MNVLLSVKPEFALEIFKGTKKFEYRRIIFKEQVERVVVYASSPMQMVIGEFAVNDILFEDLHNLWFKTKHHSGISRQYFYRYFSNKEKGYAIKVGKPTKYKSPRSLHELYGIKAPQSFAYIDK